jgi:hypothetical protein
MAINQTLIHSALRRREVDDYVDDMSELSPQRVARHLKQGRSAVTNGKRTLIGVKGSSKYGRRYRDLIACYSEELGGNPSQTEMGMIRQAAALSIRSEMIQAALINGEPNISDDDLIRISSEVRRILDGLAEKASKRKPAAVPSIHDYVAANYGDASDEER